MAEAGTTERTSAELYEAIRSADDSHQDFVEKTSLDLARQLAAEQVETSDQRLFIWVIHGVDRHKPEVTSFYKELEDRFGKTKLGQPIAEFGNHGVYGGSGPTLERIALIPNPTEDDFYPEPVSPLRYRFIPGSNVIGRVILPVVLQHIWRRTDYSSGWRIRPEELDVHPTAEVVLGVTRRNRVGGDITTYNYIHTEVGFDNILEKRDMGLPHEARNDAEFLNRVALARTAFDGYRPSEP